MDARRELGASRKELWEGIEVEGRLTGVPTLFVATQRSIVSVKAVARDYGHVYLLPEAWSGASQEWWSAWEELARRICLTIEVPCERIEEIPRKLRAAPTVRIQLTLAITQQAFDAIKCLRPQDELRVNCPAMFNVFSVQRSAMLFNAPEDYEGDTPLGDDVLDSASPA